MSNKEIAKLLNISPTALSLIVNNKPGISETMRNRVLNQLEELGLANIVKKRATLSVAAPNLCFVVYKRHGMILDQHPFFLLLMESIENQARLEGFNILITTLDNRNPITPQIDRLNRMDIQGVIVFATEMEDSDLKNLGTLQHPFIALDNEFTRLDVDTVAINNEMGTFQSIEHLVNLGHKRIGYLQSHVRINSFMERERGYKEALQSFGMSLDPEDIFKIQYTEEGSYQDFKKILARGATLPTALVADVDTIAAGAMRALHEAGFKLPQDVSLVGFDNRPLCKISLPPLTTINVPKYSFGAEAVNALVRLIKHNEESNGNGHFGRSMKVRISTQLIIRGSTCGNF